MKKVILTVCLLLVVALCLVPIPSKIKDGGSIHLSPIIPTYAVRIHHAEMITEDHRVVYEQGFSIYLFGMEIYEHVYYVEDEQHELA